MRFVGGSGTMGSKRGSRYLATGKALGQAEKRETRSTKAGATGGHIVVVIVDKGIIKIYNHDIRYIVPTIATKYPICSISPKYPATTKVALMCR